MITISVDTADSRQTLDGFGASGAWWAQAVGRWSDDNRQRVVDLLFNPTTGIGLTIFRYNIGGGEQNLVDPWRMTETFETGPRQYDWSRDANAMWVLRAARDAGATDVVVFANSPPGRLTISGRAAGNPGGSSNLTPENFDDFAQYLVDITRHLIEDEHIPVRWISPINEPQWDWQPSKGQEGAHYTTDEIKGVLLALQSAIDESDLDVRISTIEAGEWSSASMYARVLFEEPQLAQALDHFAVHSYWSSAAEKQTFVRFMERHYPDVPLWMSEWTEMREGRDYGMDSALVMANVIHDDLTIGEVTSWQYWIAVSKYNFRDGLIYTREYGERIEPTKRLWVMGNYSRFVRPGAVRLAAASDHDAVRATAFQIPGTEAITLVVINNSRDPQTIALDGITAAGQMTSMYSTSEANDLAQVYSGAVRQTYTLEASSVTTIVFESESGA
ncbi:MAG: xylanase [Anaerolineae bacterium]|nr:xylanase [Anaerolineae bacterium]